MARTEKVYSPNSSVMALQIVLLGVAIPNGTQAQSVLERVLSQIDGSTNLVQVNGVYANIAESVLLSETRSRTVTSNVSSNFMTANPGTVVATISDGNGNSYDVLRSDFPVSGVVPLFAASTGLTDHLLLSFDGNVDPVDANYTADTYSLFGVNGTLLGQVLDQASSGINGLVYLEPNVSSVEIFQVPLTTTIDGSITNIITGVTESTQEAIAGAATATEFTIPSIDIGEIATTALGAVNTGDISVGVNAAVNEAITSAARAISASLTVVGGSADTSILMLNVAHNTSTIQGNVTNTLIAVNGSVGDITTTALGAVNTGTITNGVDAVIQGIVGSAGVN